MKLKNLPQIVLVLTTFLVYRSWAWVLFKFCRDRKRWRQRAIRFTGTMSRIISKQLNFHVTLHGGEYFQKIKDRGCLMVANHCSYMDILLLSWQQPASFITSVEMGNTPFLGGITRVGGSLYTERDKPVSLPQEIKRFAGAIKEGFPVVLFPEGTSTDGATIKDFRSSLFQVAVEAQCPILPICIKYTHIDRKPFSRDNHKLICWYGDMGFMPHFLGMMGHRFDVEITVLPPIEFDAAKTRAQLSQQVRDQLLEIYHNTQ
jgi:1-acyl-sn-glycerol-3-phosphate acyltransferase